jgi:hypothetical protein
MARLDRHGPDCTSEAEQNKNSGGAQIWQVKSANLTAVFAFAPCRPRLLLFELLRLFNLLRQIPRSGALQRSHTLAEAAPSSSSNPQPPRAAAVSAVIQSH